MISVYPQMWANYRLKSVAGLNFNYLTFNIVGHFCYSVYNLCLYFVESFRNEYYKHHLNSGEVPVYLNDVAFALHSLLINVLTGIQCFIYEQGDQRLHFLTKTIVIFIILGGITLILLPFLHITSLLAFAYYMSTIKLIITCLKYSPQVNNQFPSHEFKFC